jgi:hypothetical protein
MPSLHLRTRVDTLCALFAAAIASVAVLGSAVFLFADAGRTPTFEAGSWLAHQAERCRDVPSVQARHHCLRDVASSPAPAPLAALSSSEPPLP